MSGCVVAKLWIKGDTCKSVGAKDAAARGVFKFFCGAWRAEGGCDGRQVSCVVACVRQANVALMDGKRGFVKEKVPLCECQVAFCECQVALCERERATLPQPKSLFCVLAMKVLCEGMQKRPVDSVPCLLSRGIVGVSALSADPWL